MTKALPASAVLPVTGKSRWSRIKNFSHISRETFRKLSKQGKAPQPERMGIRCTYYDNQELHKWLADPAGYSVDSAAEPIAESEEL